MEVLDRVLSGIMLTLMLASMLTSAVYIQPVKASGTIYIRTDGSVDPPTAPISSVDNVTYTFTDNIYHSIVVWRDNIVVDGLGYTLQGTGGVGTGGIDLSGRSNVTIKNITIEAFYYGIWLEYSSSNTISGNNIANNGYGIALYHYSSYNSISGNNITANNWGGFDLSYVSCYNSISGNNITANYAGILLFMSSYNSIYHNNFVNNKTQIYSDESVNVWDDGYPSGGNYWSDYSGVDLHSGPNQNQPGSDGIGDTSYVDIDPMIPDNRDCYPLMQPPTVKAYIYIQHTYVGDLVVKVGVGNPSKPLWSKVVWNRAGGHLHDLRLNVDLAEAIQWMPPGKNRWYLQVYDAARYDQGQIREFTITYLGKQNFSSTDVPVPIHDFTTSYAYKPSLGQAHIYIKHTYRGDLVVDIGVGSTSSPLWSKRVWNGTGGSADNLDLYIGLSSAVAYLPPSATYNWWVKVYDNAAKDTGNITTFTITYHGKTFTSPNVPVPIYDFKTSYAYIKG